MAMYDVRMRVLSGGTAGLRTGLVNTPPSKSARQKRSVFSMSPIRSGTMGVSAVPTLNPSDLKPATILRPHGLEPVHPLRFGLYDVQGRPARRRLWREAWRR